MTVNKIPRRGSCESRNQRDVTQHAARMDQAIDAEDRIERNSGEFLDKIEKYGLFDPTR